MKILDPVKTALGSEVTGRAEKKLSDSKFLVHTDRCPECDNDSLQIHRLDRGDVVAKCDECGFSVQGKWSRESAKPKSPNSS